MIYRIEPRLTVHGEQYVVVDTRTGKTASDLFDVPWEADAERERLEIQSTQMKLEL
jgi:hypothetical protein